MDEIKKENKLKKMMKTYWDSVGYRELNETTYRTLLGLWRPDIYGLFDLKIARTFKYITSETEEQLSERFYKLHKEMGIEKILEPDHLR